MRVRACEGTQKKSDVLHIPGTGSRGRAQYPTWRPAPCTSAACGRSLRRASPTGDGRRYPPLRASARTALLSVPRGEKCVYNSYPPSSTLPFASASTTFSPLVLHHLGVSYMASNPVGFVTLHLVGERYCRLFLQCHHAAQSSSDMHHGFDHRVGHCRPLRIMGIGSKLSCLQ